MSKASNKTEFLWHHKTKYSFQCACTWRNLLVLVILAGTSLGLSP